MRSLRHALPLALLVTLASTTPAHANLADWLDKLGELSGPGPWIQRAGIALDFACAEGQWWKDPAIDRQALDSFEFEQAVIGALGQKATNPFEISAVIRELLKVPRADLQGRLVDNAVLTRPLIDIFNTNRAATMRVLQQLARTQYWVLRERLFAAGGRSIDEVLRDNGIDPALFKQDVDVLKESLTLAFTPFCTGDLRKDRFSAGLYTAWFTTDTLPRDYTYDASKASLSPRINAYPLAFTLKTSLPFPGLSRHQVILRSWDLGFSIGAIRFQPEDDNRFEGFWLGPYVEFPRIILRPLAGIACEVRGDRCPGQWTKWDLLELELVRKSIAGYDRAKFGATSIPGLTADRESQWWVRIGLSIKFHRDQTDTRLVQ